MLAATDSFKTDSFRRIESDLEHCGYAVAHNFADATDSALLAAECRVLHGAEQLSAAAVGRGDARSEQAHIRSDLTRWFNADVLAPGQLAYWQHMEGLRVELNRSLFLGLEELEAHYALYPVGARYARHRDRFRDDDARMLSSVLYLNPDWGDEEGGALRLHLGAHAQNLFVDIYPTSGTLVLFLSAEFEHEVLPATRERLSIAGWFKQHG